jgi:hypothetical protein
MLSIGAAHHNICSTSQIVFCKVQRTETFFVYGYGALHLDLNFHKNMLQIFRCAAPFITLD